MRRAVPYSYSVWFVMPLWALITGAILYWAFWRMYDNYRFDDHGRQMQATVLRKFITKTYSKNGTPYNHYNIVYGYEVADLLGNCQVEVQTVTWSMYAERGFIPIKYLPEDPKKSRIDNPVENDEAVFKARCCTGLGLVFLLGGSIYSVYTIRRNKIQRRLVATGLSCLGKVTSVGTERAGKSGYKSYLRIEFSDNRGRTVTGRTWQLNRKQEKLWHEGKKVTVFYDPTDSHVFTVDLNAPASRIRGE